jgi:Uma2 family endonuclease
MAEAASVDQLLGPQISLEEWIELPEDFPGEFVDGRLVEEEVTDYLHEVLVAWLARQLGNWAEGADAIVAGSEAKFVLSSSLGRKPDLTVYFAGRRPPARGGVRLPPDIAVEVISSTPRDQRRDRVHKMADYASFGIRFYWIVDPQQRTLEIYERDVRGVYVERLKTTGGRIGDVPGCPGLTLDVDLMWTQVDTLER